MFEFLQIQRRLQEKEASRAAFDESLEKLRHTLREQAHPRQFLFFRPKPQFLIAGAVAGVSFLRALFGKRGIGMKNILSLIAPFVFKTLIRRLRLGK
jgi:hypothetical protein